MTTFIFSDLEPVARLRSAIPETCQPMLDQLFGMVPLPPDQPSCATATATWRANPVHGEDEHAADGAGRTRPVPRGGALAHQFYENAPTSRAQNPVRLNPPACELRRAEGDHT